MICPKCGGSGKTTEYDGLRKFWCDYKCEMCNGMGEVLTEQEYIQTCNTEQLAEYLASTFDLCGAGCHNCFLAEECLTKAKDGDYRTQEQMIADWLKQQHTVKE